MATAMATTMATAMAMLNLQKPRFKLETFLSASM
jgi:hypothetical protein